MLGLGCSCDLQLCSKVILHLQVELDTISGQQPDAERHASVPTVSGI